MIKFTAPNPLVENHILTILPPPESDRLLPYLEPVSFRLKEVLFTTGEPIQYVYFLKSGLVSLLSMMADGRTVEVGSVGSEGVVGLSALMGSGPSCNQAIVQVSGSAVRIKAGLLKEEFKRGGVLQDLLLGCAQDLYAQASQTAACNGLHTVEKRLARWLLLVRDHSPSDRLEVTQELLAQMLGVGRSTVTLTAIELQRARLIEYSRGKIRILDRTGLEEVSCECYRAVRKLYQRDVTVELFQAAFG